MWIFMNYAPKRQRVLGKSRFSYAYASAFQLQSSLFPRRSCQTSMNDITKKTLDV